MLRPALSAVACLVTAACVSPPPPPPPPVAVTMSLPLDAARQRAEAALRAEGFQPETDAGAGVRGRSGSVAAGDALCPRILVKDRRDGSLRADWTEPHGRSGTVSIALAEAEGGVRAVVTGTFAADYTNRYTNTSFEARCTSTGALEQRLGQALAGG